VPALRIAAKAARLGTPVVTPPLRAAVVRGERVLHVPWRSGAGVEFESKVLKPCFRFIGSRFEAGRFQAMGQLHSTCTAAPGNALPFPRGPGLEDVVVLRAPVLVIAIQVGP
jgi:hypothetical protein